MLTMRNSADDVRMTYVPSDDMRMTYMPADVMQTTYPPADNVRTMFLMTYVICQPKSPTKSRSRDICTSCGWCADDMHMTPGVVLHEIRQLRQGSHLEQLCIKPTGLLVKNWIAAGRSQYKWITLWIWPMKLVSKHNIQDFSFPVDVPYSSTQQCHHHW